MNKMSVHPTDVEGLIERARNSHASGYMPRATRELIADLAQALSLLSQERATVGGSAVAESAEPASLSRSAVVPEAEQAGGWRDRLRPPAIGAVEEARLRATGERLRTYWDSLPEPRAWWAETGAAGASEGRNRPFWLKHEAVAYVREHGGYVRPLFVAPEPPEGA